MIISSAGYLAQIGIPSPEGIVSAYFWSVVICTCWAVVLLASIIATAVGAVRFRRPSGKIMVGIGGVITLSLVYTAYVVVVPPHHSLVLDLSSSRTSPAGNWKSEGTGGESLYFQGRVDAVIKLPDGNTFNDRATLIEVDRQDGQVSRISIQKSGIPSEKAFALAGKYIKAWNFDGKNFDQWCSDRRADKRGSYNQDTLFYSYKNQSNPSLALELRETVSDSWALNLNVNWPRESTTHEMTP